MEIIVVGKGSVKKKVDIVKIEFQFNYKGDIYEDTLKKGTESVNRFIDRIKLSGFNSKDLITETLRVSEEKKYNDQTRTYELNGYNFCQIAYIKFDYDQSLLAKLLEGISKLEKGPEYKLYFEIKENDLLKEQVLDLEYKDALFQANLIAKSAGCKIKECRKVSFKPFDDQMLSNSILDTGTRLAKAYSSIQDNILNTFVPEDINVEKVVYCLFVAEK